MKAALATLLVLVAPALASACPACGGGGTEESRLAYVASTVVLSLLPLGMIFGLVYWVWRHARRA